MFNHANSFCLRSALRIAKSWAAEKPTMDAFETPEGVYSVWHDVKIGWQFQNPSGKVVKYSNKRELIEALALEMTIAFREVSNGEERIFTKSKNIQPESDGTERGVCQRQTRWLPDF